MRSIFLFLFLTIIPHSASADRTVMDLSQYDWGVFRDFEAQWVNDDIHFPPVDISMLPSNPPSGGWDSLRSGIEKTVRLPATIEEHFTPVPDRNASGDFRGISWWTTMVTPGPEFRGKRVFLDFESVHLRAEVFVNRKLVGYDVIGHTPFSAEVTGALEPGRANVIAVRITDPCGNFSWNDREIHRWGKHFVPAAHGFGGITGKVFLRAVDPVFVEDIWVRNTPKIITADVVATFRNLESRPVAGTVAVKVYPWKRPGEVIWKKDIRKTVAPGASELTFAVNAPQAKAWDLDHPELYAAEVTFASKDGKFRDTTTQRFGFRWFDVYEKNGDKRFSLNGKRIVLRSGMSWGFWPLNGVFPTPEMAERDVRVAKELGLTLMNFHRAIGQPPVMDAADELGFLAYEEPGGYSCEGAGDSDSLWRAWRKEKLLRMVKRDRSRPSLIIYNLQNRTPNERTPEDAANLRAAHALDPTRPITFISGFWEEPPQEHPSKLHFLPNDFTERNTGWYDMHLFSPSQGYQDRFYTSPKSFDRRVENRDEIIYWGEDGAINNPPMLGSIHTFHERNKVRSGWLAGHLEEWYRAYDDFLDRSGFRECFPDVDSLTRSIGNVSLTYHGRILENIRAGNVTDCYTINGWAANHLTNFCDIVDLYRNPIGDPTILARYARPLFLAVKLRDKVVPAGSTVAADIFIVNETGLSGPHDLTVTAEGPDGAKLLEKTFRVNILGGDEYGQLLAENIAVPLGVAHGRRTVQAELRDASGAMKAEGGDEAFAVDAGGRISPRGAVIDSSGVINRALAKHWEMTLPRYSEEAGAVDYIIIGSGAPDGSAQFAPLLERTANGATLIVLDRADRFTELLAGSYLPTLDYRGRYDVSRGTFVAGKHELLDGLPQGTAFNWEYQTLYSVRKPDLTALKLYGGKTVVAAVVSGQKEIGTALTVVPYGRGKIVLCTLPLLPRLSDDAPQSVVARRLFRNLLVYAGKRE
ncbi:MAG: glycoside hydrolase family 2 protein [Candidatus Latescibacterota bacterium]